MSQDVVFRVTGVILHLHLILHIPTTLTFVWKRRISFHNEHLLRDKLRPGFYRDGPCVSIKLLFVYIHI